MDQPQDEAAAEDTGVGKDRPKVSPSGDGNPSSSGLQPGGTIPGGGPGASVGSIGTGGGSTGGSGTGNAA